LQRAAQAFQKEAEQRRDEAREENDTLKKKFR
jgi:hypothetical protein